MEGDTKSDFTTTKKMADFSYMKKCTRRGKHKGWKWLFEKDKIYQKSYHYHCIIRALLTNFFFSFVIFRRLNNNEIEHLPAYLFQNVSVLYLL